MRVLSSDPLIRFARINMDPSTDTAERAVNESAALARKAIQAAAAAGVASNDAFPGPDESARSRADAGVDGADPFNDFEEIREFITAAAGDDNASEAADEVAPEAAPAGRVLRSRSSPSKTPSKGRKRASKDVSTGPSKRRTRSVMASLFADEEGIEEAEDAENDADDDDASSLP